MKAERLHKLCIKYGVELSRDQYVRVLSCMTVDQAKAFLHGLSGKQGNQEAKEAMSILHKPVELITEEEIASAANDRGMAKRVMIHLRDEAYRAFDLAAKFREDAVMAKQILDHVMAIEDETAPPGTRGTSKKGPD